MKVTVEKKSDSDSSKNSSGETDSHESESSSDTGNSGDNETDESDSREKNDSDSSENSSGETDSHESSSDMDSDTDSNEADIDKLKPKSIRSGSKITFKCPVCCFRCPSTGHIYGHMVKEHGAKKFQCEKCDFSTENKTSLLNHIRCYCKGRGLKPKHFLTKRKVPTRQVKNAETESCPQESFVLLRIL